MKSEEKEDVMEKFSKNKIQFLISTTVIELGKCGKYDCNDYMMPIDMDWVNYIN